MQLGQLGSLPPAFAILRDCSLDSPRQVGLTKRLGKEVDRARLHRTHRTGNVAMSGEEYDLRVLFTSDLALEIQPVDARQVHVQNKASWQIWLGIREVLGSRTERDHMHVEGRKEI